MQWSKVLWIKYVLLDSPRHQETPKLTIDAVKIAPHVLFLTQVYGTVFGALVNYAVMISNVSSNCELLINSNGDSSWSGANMQSYNKNPIPGRWQNTFKTVARYAIVPLGIIIGAVFVIVHRAIVYVGLHLSLC